MGKHVAELTESQKKANKFKAWRGTLIVTGICAALGVGGFAIGPLIGAAFGSLLLALSGIWGVSNRAFEEAHAEISDSQWNQPLALTGIGGAIMLGAAIAAVVGAVVSSSHCPDPALVESLTKPPASLSEDAAIALSTPLDCQEPGMAAVRTIYDFFKAR